MNTLDIIFLTILGFFCLRGFFRGIIREVAGILGLLVGFFVANNYYPEAMPYISPYFEDTGNAEMAAYLAVFLGTMLTIWIVARLISTLLEVAMLAWVDHGLGGVFGFVKGTLLCAVIVLAITSFMPRSTMVAESRLAPRIAQISGILAELVPEDAEGPIKDAKEHIDDFVEQMKAIGSTVNQ